MNILLSIFENPRTVFRFQDIAMLTGEMDAISLGKKLNYLVKTGRLLNPRKGIYTRLKWNSEELACRLYSPSYLSLDYVLQQSGIVFQYDPTFTLVSNLSRGMEVSGMSIRFHKIKEDILMNTQGIIRMDNSVNKAYPERALLDKLYLIPDFYIDRVASLNKEMLLSLVQIYKSVSLEERLNKIIDNDQHH